jgi:hypothetical protein
MKIKASLLTLLLLGSVAPAAAQDISLPTLTGTARLSNFQEPFADRNGQAAKELAAGRNISTEAATRALRRMHAAGLIARAFYLNEPGVAGVYSDDSGITVAVKSGSVSVPAALARATAVIDPSLASLVRIVAVERSLSELQAEVSRLEAKLGQSEDLEGFSVTLDSNQVFILSSDVPRTTERVRTQIGQLPPFVTIKASDPIEVTQQVFGGTAANTEVAGCPTFGFTVQHTDGRRGLLTVAHTDYTTLRFNGYSATNLASCTGGTSMSQQYAWKGGPGVDSSGQTELGRDFAWFRGASSFTYEPLFWDGSNVAVVWSARYTAGGDRVCKFGRRTRKTCGAVTNELVYSQGYGYMSQVRAEAGVVQMNDIGDSGGPVWFSTNTAVGIVHGKQGATYMLYNDIAALETRNLPVRVVIQP